MKKLFYLFFALPLMLLSCSDDNNLPEFDVQVTFSEGTQVENGTITVPQGQSFTIESIVPINSSAKDIAFGAVTYQLDYGLNYTTVLSPYTMTFETENLPVGRHLLRIMFPVYAVDYSPAQAILDYTLVITDPVPDEGGDDTGEGGDTGDTGSSNTFIVKPSIKAQSLFYPHIDHRGGIGPTQGPIPPFFMPCDTVKLFFCKN